MDAMGVACIAAAVIAVLGSKLGNPWLEFAGDSMAAVVFAAVGLYSWLVGDIVGAAICGFLAALFFRIARGRRPWIDSP